MATLREIQALLKEVNVVVDKQDIDDAIEIIFKGEEVKKEGTVEEFLQNNAEYIQFKKLLLIIVKRLQELVNRYREAGISFLMRQTEEDLQKAITFAKRYIKPEEFIKVETANNRVAIGED